MQQNPRKLQAFLHFSTLQAVPKTDQKRLQDRSCSNLFQALSHSTASHKTSVNYVVLGLLLHLQGTPKSTKIGAKMLSEPSCNKCSKLRPNCAAYPKTLVKYTVFVAFFAPQPTQNRSRNRSKTHLKQAFQKAVARGRSGLGSCGPMASKSSKFDHKSQNMCKTHRFLHIFAPQRHPRITKLA